MLQTFRSIGFAARAYTPSNANSFTSLSAERLDMFVTCFKQY